MNICGKFHTGKGFVNKNTSPENVTRCRKEVVQVFFVFTVHFFAYGFHILKNNVINFRFAHGNIGGLIFIKVSCGRILYKSAEKGRVNVPPCKGVGIKKIPVKGNGHMIEFCFCKKPNEFPYFIGSGGKHDEDVFHNYLTHIIIYASGTYVNKIKNALSDGKNQDSFFISTAQSFAEGRSPKAKQPFFTFAGRVFKNTPFSGSNQV